MPAPNQIHFYAAPTIGWAHSQAAPFKAQFGAPVKAPLFDPDELIELQLAAAALDCGYGTRAAELGALAGADWTALQAYLQARQRLMLTTLAVTPTAVTQQAFAARIEKSERTSLSFLLGCVMNRLATERWAAEVLHAPIQNFWHLDVATDAAVSLLAWPTPLKALLPDFVFQAGGDWYTAEAKGSYRGLDWDELRAGLMQASSIGRIGLLDVDNAGPALTLAPIKAATCAMAHFNRGYLRVTHVDPPRREAPLQAPPPLWVAAFAPLVRLERALARFDALPAARLAAPPWRHAAPGYEWRLLDGLAHGEAGALWLGAPEALLAQRRSLVLALALLRALLPLCTIRARARPTQESVFAALQAPIANAGIRPALRRAGRVIPALTASEADWLHEVEAGLATAEAGTKAGLLTRLSLSRLPDGGTLADLGGLLAQQARRSLAHLALDRQLPARGRRAEGPAAWLATDSGLLVARSG